MVLCSEVDACSWEWEQHMKQRDLMSDSSSQCDSQKKEENRERLDAFWASGSEEFKCFISLNKTFFVLLYSYSTLHWIKQKLEELNLLFRVNWLVLCVLSDSENSFILSGAEWERKNSRMLSCRASGFMCFCFVKLFRKSSQLKIISIWMGELWINLGEIFRQTRANGSSAARTCGILKISLKRKSHKFINSSLSSISISNRQTKSAASIKSVKVSASSRNSFADEEPPAMKSVAYRTGGAASAAVRAYEKVICVWLMKINSPFHLISLRLHTLYLGIRVRCLTIISRVISMRILDLILLALPHRRHHHHHQVNTEENVSAEKVE